MALELGFVGLFFVVFVDYFEFVCESSGFVFVAFSQ